MYTTARTERAARPNRSVPVNVMMQCPIPHDDDARLAALRKQSILDTAPEHAFDRLTRLARLALNMPIVLVSLVDRERQWFKSRQGLSVSETPRSISFCGHAITQTEPFIVPDAMHDARFVDSPLVVGEPFVRSYIGIPLNMRDGYAIGTLCAMDIKPRVLSAEEIDVLQDLAGMVVDAIELRQLAVADSLTGTLTRRGLDMEIEREFSRAKRSQSDLSLIAVDIDHFKSVNDRFGHSTGDVVLKAIASCLRKELRTGDIVARMGGEEFLIMLPDTDRHGAMVLAERARQRIADTEIKAHGHCVRVTASFGIATCGPADPTWRIALQKADTALYAAKRSGRNRIAEDGDRPETAAA